MTILRFVPRLFGAVVFAVAAPMGALGAQGFTFASATSVASPGTACTGGVGTVSDPSNSQVNCSVSIMSYQARAASAAGRIGAYSSVVALPGGQAGDGSGASMSQSRWRDVVSFAPGSVTPAYARVSALFTGALSAYFPNTSLYGSTASVTMSLTAGSLGGGPSQYTYEQFTAAPGYSQPGYPVPSQVDATYDQSLWLEVPIVNIGASSGFFFEQFLRTDANVNFHYSIVSEGAYAVSDFSNGGVIDGISFLDANRQDITSQVAYTTQYGTEIVTATPEPATMMLVGTGLLVLAGVRRRSRRYQH